MAKQYELLELKGVMIVAARCLGNNISEIVGIFVDLWSHMYQEYPMVANYKSLMIMTRGN